MRDKPVFKFLLNIGSQLLPETRGSVPITKPGQLLIVEDDQILTLKLSNSLREAGYEVLSAADNDEALRLIAQKPPEILLFDIATGDGMKALKRIRTLASDLPIVIIGSTAHSSDAEQARELGVRDFLDKPIDMSALVEKIRLALLPR